jgi:hypothetical protein
MGISLATNASTASCDRLLRLRDVGDAKALLSLPWDLDDRTLAAVELGRSDRYEAVGPQGALSDQPRRTSPANPNAALLFWGAGGGAQCDAAFLGSRRWSARERHR